MKIDTAKLEKLLDNAMRWCATCRSSSCGHYCEKRAIIEACGKRVPRKETVTK